MKKNDNNIKTNLKKNNSFNKISDSNINENDLEINYPIPFDNKWDISKISNEKKSYLVTSKLMYTTLLDDVLSNRVNLNVIIDKNKDSGMIYKNDIEKYVQMKSKDIIDKTMEKLNELLIEINKDENLIFDEIKDFSRKMINKKYIDFQKNPSVQQNVNILISDIFEYKKCEAMEIAKKVMENPHKDKGY